MAVIEDQIVLGPLKLRAARVEAFDAGHDRPDIAEFSAGVHLDGAANGSRDSGKAFDSRQPGADGAQHEFLDIHSGSGVDVCAGDGDLAPGFVVEAEDGAVDPFIADEQICSQAQDVDRDVRFGAAESGFLNIILRFRPDVPARRPAELVPGVRSHRLVFGDEPFESGEWIGGNELHFSICQFPADFPHIAGAHSHDKIASAGHRAEVGDDFGKIGQVHGLTAIGLQARDQVG